MTIEDKAQAYDTAIRKAQDVFHTSEFIKITDLFPELAESEDDRIRKTLSVLVQNAIYPGLITEEDSKKCLAYLEKQKERGPLTKEEKYILHCIIEYLDDETCPSEWISLLHGIYCLPYGKQKESAEKEYVFRPLGGTDITVAAEQAIKRVNEGERLVLAFNGAYIPVIKGYDANEIVDIYNTFVEKKKEPPFVKDVNVGYPGHYFYDGNRMYLCSSPALEEKQKEQSITANDLDEEIHRFFDDCIEVHDAKIYGVDERVITVDCYEITARHFAKWGEKQKERKPVECIEFDNEFEKQVSHLLASVLNGEWEYDEGFVKHAAQSLLGYAKHELELDGKALLYTADKSYQIGFRDGVASVKPAEWSESDKGVLMDAICATDKLGNNEVYNKNNPNLAKAFRVAKDWLKNLPERFNLPQTQEWSEEDEKDVAHIIRILDDCYAYGKHDLSKTDHENLVGTLKSLRLQPKLEWSEEDEHRRDGIIQWLREYQAKFNLKYDSLSIESIESLIDWLKSIRPSWKPNEEQMEALDKARRFIPYNCYVLESLYVDLKKL